MPRSIDLQLDVSEAAGPGEPASIAVTVTLPEPRAPGTPPVVCFAKPGGGYSRRYFTLDLPGPARGAQADWHAARGWIFVSVDPLGVGESRSGRDPAHLDHATVAAASHAAESQLLEALVGGTLAPDFPAIERPVRLGIGQSLGGCLTVVQQARHRGYDGIAVLGFSAVHTQPPAPPGEPPIVTPSAGGSWSRMRWAFHWDDVDEATVRADMERSAGALPPWASATLPSAIASSCMAPGAIATEAAAVSAPVLVAMGERDVIADPRGELRAYRSASSVDLFVCPRMGHMHGFAGTRALLWRRIESWAGRAASLRDACPG